MFRPRFWKYRTGSWLTVKHIQHCNELRILSRCGRATCLSVSGFLSVCSYVPCRACPNKIVHVGICMCLRRW